MVQDYGQNSGPLSFSESYTTNIRNSQAINESPFGQSGQVEVVNLGGKLNGLHNAEFDYRRNSRDSHRLVFGNTGSKLAVAQKAREINHGLSARSDNQNCANSGPDAVSVADSSGVETGNVNEVQNEKTNSITGAAFDRNAIGSRNGTDCELFNPEIAQSARINSPAQVAAFDAGNATNKPALDDGQMPQSNATNATMQSVEFAKPSGWGKLWRMVENGNYYYYELRFINAKRVRRKGGKITPQIAKQLNRRKGKGRHKESRKDAERMRSQAEHIARSV